ncbi:multicopper oxidase family protein [Crenobacter cavernae]|uniref:Copper oxidase n=1 Tax=Crenobacter cavernae TaxID=2290923 RepID=A0A345Y2B8_9NEIS|nr:copper oxidase [Crenobacter cavernae]AXK38070.1 copper oxidase [Crenobacter cavernae]
MDRRKFLSVGAASAGVLMARAAMAAPQAGVIGEAGPAAGGHAPVVTLNGKSAKWRMRDGVKEFHLIAEEVEREFAPGMKVKCWGYNGMTPGPTLEAVEGERIRIYVTNKLKEHTTVHWHGLFLPSGMDGVGGLSQPHIKPGETYAYEFTLKNSGTFMYHPHADEMVQLALGMMGLFIVHPKRPVGPKPDRDYAMLLHNWDIEPGTRIAKPATMTDFNLWTINSKVFPAIAPMVARTGERVRIRIGNLSMHEHPMHLHGFAFKTVGTDGGWVPVSAQMPEVTVIVGVGQTRTIEFVADEPGDWAFHCHKSHHTMNAMGHDTPNLIGVDQKAAEEKLRDIIPGYMAMGSNGMADMSEMAGMPLPDNTLPMMDGKGPYGPLEMGGMFTVLKVRDRLPAGDYRDPGWYQAPKGTVAYKTRAPDFS